MPKVNIELLAGCSAEQRAQISEAIQAAMESALGSTPDSMFQLFTEYDSSHLRRSTSVTARGGQSIFITFYLGPRPEDIVANLFASTVRELGERASLTPPEINLIIVNAPSSNWWWDGKNA